MQGVQSMISDKTRDSIELMRIYKGIMLSILSVLFVLSSFTNVPAADKSDIKISVKYG